MTSFFALFRRAVFNSNGIKGEVELHQPSMFEPTWLNFTVHSAKNELRENTEFVRDLAGYYIRQLPPDPVLFGTKDFCNSSRDIFNPTHVDDSNLPPPGYGKSIRDCFNCSLALFGLFRIAHDTCNGMRSRNLDFLVQLWWKPFGPILVVFK